MSTRATVAAKRRRRRRRNNKQAGDGSKGSIFTAPVLQVSIPKPALSLHQVAGADAKSGHSFVAEGEEVVSQVNTTVAWEYQAQPFINPLDPEFSPRLAAIAMAFERYRMRELSVCYHPACPTTRSGALGMMIDFDPSDQGPINMQEIASNEAGAVGSVGAPLKISASWPATEPYLVTSANSSASASDANWRFPGRLWVCSAHAVSADANSIAGYISVRYRVEFLRLRPTPQTVAASSCEAEAKGGTLSTQVIDLLWQNVVGDWGTSASVDPNPQFSTTNRNQVAEVAQGIYSAVFDWTVGATAAVQEEKDFDTIDRRPPLVAKWRNPKFLPKGSKWQNLCSLEEMSPQAANDFTVYFSAYDPTTEASSVIASWLFNSATQVVVADGVSWENDTDVICFWQLTPTGTETRALVTPSLQCISKQRSGE
jgi:hypothetical protein